MYIHESSKPVRSKDHMHWEEGGSGKPLKVLMTKHIFILLRCSALKVLCLSFSKLHAYSEICTYI